MSALPYTPGLYECRKCGERYASYHSVPADYRCRQKVPRRPIEHGTFVRVGHDEVPSGAYYMEEAIREGRLSREEMCRGKIVAATTEARAAVAFFGGRAG